MHPKERGVLTESVVLNKLLEKSISVSQPFGDNERYDYIIDVDGELLKIQVKTARDTPRDNGTIMFNTESVKSNINQNRRESYDGDIDAFIAYHPGLDKFYWLDIDEAPDGGSIWIRVEEPDNPNPNINWEDDYLLDNRL